MAAEHCLERLVVAAPRDRLEPPRELARPPDEADDGEDQREDDDEEPADDRADVGRDERVEIDRSVLLGGWPEFSARSFAAAHLRTGAHEPRCYPSAAMAKRTRYPDRTTPRPAAKRPAAGAAADRPVRLAPADEPLPVDLPDDAPMVASRAALSEAEVDRAAELEAQATAREKAAIAESLRRRQRADASLAHDPGDINAPLSVRAAHEYAYVARDVKRIALTASVMVAILAVLHILVNVMGVISF
jgi:hypothetical protein